MINNYPLINIYEKSSLKSKLYDLENKQKEIAERLKLELSILPNLPDEDVPIGDEECNQEIKKK